VRGGVGPAERERPRPQKEAVDRPKPAAAAAPAVPKDRPKERPRGPDRPDRPPPVQFPPTVEVSKTRGFNAFLKRIFIELTQILCNLFVAYFTSLPKFS